MALTSGSPILYACLLRSFSTPVVVHSCHFLSAVSPSAAFRFKSSNNSRQPLERRCVWSVLSLCLCYCSYCLLRTCFLLYIKFVVLTASRGYLPGISQLDAFIFIFFCFGGLCSYFSLLFLCLHFASTLGLSCRSISLSVRNG